MGINEIHRSSDSEPKPTPRELNVRLHGLIDLFPPPSFLFPPESSEMKRFAEELGEPQILKDLAGAITVGSILNEERRQRSEMKDRVLTRIAELAQYSHTTTYFWPIVLQELSDTYDMGLIKEKPRDEEVVTNDREPGWEMDTDYFMRKLQDLDYPNSGGVFDEGRAPEIEIKCYQYLVGLQLMTEQVLKESMEEAMADENKKEVLLQAFEVDEKDRKERSMPSEDKWKVENSNEILQQWRQAIIDKWGIEP